MKIRSLLLGLFLAVWCGHTWAATVLQVQQNSQVAAAPSISVAITVKQGSYIEVYATCGNAAATITLPTDGTHTYAFQSSGYDSSDIQSVARYTTGPVSAGTYTVAANFSSSTGDIGVAAVEIAGSIGQIASLSGNYQSAPGTGTAGVTTGSSGTLTSAPTLLTGMTVTTHSTASITAAGGSTIYPINGTGWANIKAAFYSFETQQLTGESSVAATFTSANGNAQVSLGGIWLPSKSSAWLIFQ
jgi:hypothetical protein